SFADKYKRIAYAPSFGSSDVPPAFKEEYKNGLQDIPSISVREEAGAKIIRDLTNVDSPVLVDPTILLSDKEWLSVSRRASNRPDKQYMLTYFLGVPSVEKKEKLEKLAKKKNMIIINLGDITKKETYRTGLIEFLDYINNASVFFTDSFH